ncbi:MAG TPA: cobalamin-binding protein [Chloroflexota bacterium]|nr:cobalamin-binding protein [Chloroflexota bacterium]
MPSATEIVYALGLGDRLVAVTHECDFPPEARTKPQITASVIDSDGLTAAEIDAAVRESLAERRTIYSLDADLLADLRPDLILTQELCEVCAIGPDLVLQAVRALPAAPQVVSLEPHTLRAVLDSIRTVGALTGTDDRAARVMSDLEARLSSVAAAVSGRPVQRVLTMEWVDPVFVGGHWVPDMVAAAGGEDVLGRSGEPSREVTWQDIVDADPDIIIAMPCGFGLERSAMELQRAALPAEWHGLRAVREGRVYVVDGSSYFNRPGPRLVDGVEITATILHPEANSGGRPGAFGRFEGRVGAV